MYRLPIVLLIGALIVPASTHFALAQTSTYGDAMGWYEREAAKGSAKAQYFLGLLYEKGAGPRARDADYRDKTR